MGSWLGTLLSVILMHTPVQQEAHRLHPCPKLDWEVETSTVLLPPLAPALKSSVVC